MHVYMSSIKYPYFLFAELLLLTDKNIIADIKYTRHLKFKLNNNNNWVNFAFLCMSTHIYSNNDPCEDNVQIKPALH